MLKAKERISVIIVAPFRSHAGRRLRKSTVEMRERVQASYKTKSSACDAVVSASSFKARPGQAVAIHSPPSISPIDSPPSSDTASVSPLQKLQTTPAGTKFFWSSRRRSPRYPKGASYICSTATENAGRYGQNGM